MPRKQKKYHYIYKTTCIITGKFYIGMHSTNNLYDDYLGSGTRLRRSINKHGRDHHILEILEFHNDRKTLVLREKEIVNEEMISDGMCMNMCLGGEGGFVSKEGCIKGRQQQWLNEKFREDHAERNRERSKTPEARKRSSKIMKGVNKVLWADPEFRERACKRLSKNQTGTGNSQYGKCWIYNLEERKTISIKKEKLDEYLKLGWIKGRKLKWDPFV